MEIKISVIIPVYGIEKYIRQCLESVINQSYKNLEIIVVNDGTKDNSMKIVEEYLEDKRIKVINKENGGLSSARNLGMEEVTGEYIYFLDGDDWIEKNAIELLIMNSKEMDIIGGNFFFYNETTGKRIEKNLKVEYYKKRLGSYELQDDLEIMVCNKLYKVRYLKENNLKFVEKILHEDEEFSIRNYLIYSPNILYIKENTYNYRINRNNSIMTEIINRNRLSESVKSLNQICDSFREDLNNLLNNFQNFRLFLKIVMLDIIILKRIGKELDKNSIIYFEIKLQEFLKKNYTKEEKNILIKEIRKIIIQKESRNINILKKFYWKNRILNIFYLRKLISNKLKKYIRE